MQKQSNNNSERLQLKTVSAEATAEDELIPNLVQSNVSKSKLVPAAVNYLDESEETFYVHKKAKGSILIDLVVARIELVERDYFGLAYYDKQKIQHWLYPDKKISKQLKGAPWQFFFVVKFYPVQPAQLSEDFTRHLLYLQLRKDVYTERLPVSFAAQASLGSLVAQAVLGDYQPVDGYANHLSNAKIAQPTSEQEQFINRVRELHKLHKGLNKHEAELAYLNECKSLAMYGVHLFPAKDTKNKPVQIGVSSHGISVYNDQMRVHKFAWQRIVKICYRRSTFSIRLKPGELDPKKEVTISYYLADYLHAKLLWKCAVEHHGFFRFFQSEPKHKNSFLSFGSSRFRYTGRTNIQSQMVSQLFESTPVAVDRSKSKSAEMIAQKDYNEHLTPLNYVDELSPQKQINQQPLATSTAKKLKDDEKKTTKKAQKKKKGKKAAEGGASTSVNSSSSSSSSSSDAEEEEVHVLVDHQQPAEQITKQQSKLGTTSPKYKLVIEPPPAHTTVETWHEETIGPEQVSTEIDEQGNIIKRTVRSEQVKHTIQTQSYQAVPINGHDDANQQQFGTEQPLNSHAYENGHKDAAENDASSGDLVSSKVVTTGNRSVETLTYKTEKDGMVETRVEHRITIHSNEDIDHDAELSRAILEATSMNPELKVEKVEVERG